MIFSNDRLTFDTEEFNFAELVLSEVNNYLTSQHQPTIDSLEQIHTIDGIEENIEPYRQLLFSLFRKPHFQEVFKKFGKSIIDQHLTPDAIIQKTPTIRIQLSGGKSVSFHTDGWYGHGKTVYSFWLPMTKVYSTNSLQMARNEDESKKVIADISADQMDLNEINVVAKVICDPIEAGHGELIAFNSNMIHGTLDNETPISRVSFDFRIAESVADIGNKPASNYFTYEQLSDEPVVSTENPVDTRRAYNSLMYSGTCRGISAKSQLVFLNEYAKINNVKIMGSESEIVVFDYAPVMQTYLKNPLPTMDSLLLFSVDLLPKGGSLRQRIYASAIAKGITLIFGAEDTKLTSEQDIPKVEAAYEFAQGRNVEPAVAA